MSTEESSPKCTFQIIQKDRSITNLFKLLDLVCVLYQGRAQTWMGAHLPKNSLHGELKVAQSHSSLPEE